MTLVKRTHSPLFPSLLDEMLRPDMGGRQLRLNVPPVNIVEHPEQYELQMSVPGFNKGDIQIEINDDLLTISSVQKDTIVEENAKFTRREFYKQAFKRSFQIPETVSQDEISALHENGILTLQLPKKIEEKKEKRLISIS